MPVAKQLVCGPTYWNLSALYPIGMAMDDPSVVSNPQLWSRRGSIVKLYTQNCMLAHTKGFQLNLMGDRWTQNGRVQCRGAKLPDWSELVPNSWPAQSYLRRFLGARIDVSTELLDSCTTLHDQFCAIGSLEGWSYMTEGGIVVRSFMEATMHIVQLQFFGIPVTKVQPALTAHVQFETKPIYITSSMIFFLACSLHTWIRLRWKNCGKLLSNAENTIAIKHSMVHVVV